VKRRIRVRGVNGECEGKIWEATSILRAGRLESLDIVLTDASVSRRHAEIRATEKGWELQDLVSTNGTFINGVRLTEGPRRLRARDIVQFGKVTLLVELLEDGSPRDARQPDPIVVEAATSASWEDALAGLAYDRSRRLRPGDQLQALLRASHYLVHVEKEEELLHSILNDAVTTLDAQRGAIVLADGPRGELLLRALATNQAAPGSRPQFSQSLAYRSYTRGESVLCSSVDEDPELANAQSIHEGAMASIVCVLLRTPRKRLGVLHLDRNYWQRPFSEDDLHLADALAASVSAGIESAQLLRHQRELFLNTVNALAKAVEMRDNYTGDHTDRVTRYAHLLGQQLNLFDEELDVILSGTPLHDVGKIGINDAILQKPNQLSPAEFEIMKTHTIKGAAILASVPGMAKAIPIVRSHHEHWNGEGYPDGLAGQAIPRLARIVAVADAFDAMTTDRPYRKAIGCEEAFAELQRQSGRQFDPECVRAFLAIRDKIAHVMKPTSWAEETMLSGNEPSEPATVRVPQADLVSSTAEMTSRIGRDAAGLNRAPFEQTAPENRVSCRE
jgi:HD-GYP domain-containing protein (c-di-GMP phosphodiesterase class II)